MVGDLSDLRKRLLGGGEILLQQGELPLRRGGVACCLPPAALLLDLLRGLGPALALGGHLRAEVAQSLLVLLGEAPGHRQVLVELVVLHHVPVSHGLAPPLFMKLGVQRSGHR